ncbi:MAG: DUF5813 family protein [Haloferacaceae archaeon]
MSELPDRISRAFADHDSFEPAPVPGRYRHVGTSFDAVVDVSTDGETVLLDVRVRVPMLDEVASERVADVIEDGWYETFERRAVDVDGVTKLEREASPSVRRSVDEEGTRVAVVEVTIEDSVPRRGVEDAGAIVDYLEGTYVLGVVPGYEYGEPVSELISRARAAGSSGNGSLDLE